MPSVSEKQRKFFGAELARKRAGKSTKTKLPISELREFASKPLREKRHNPAPPFPNEQGEFDAAGKVGVSERSTLE